MRDTRDKTDPISISATTLAYYNTYAEAFWFGSDPTALRGQAKAVVEEIGQAVLVKEDEGLLIVSLPTEKLAGLRQELAKLGTMQTTAEEVAPSAPTTLLRMTFSQPSSAS